MLKTFTKNGNTYYEQPTFDDIKEMASNDIERFRNNFFVMLDNTGSIKSYTVGFVFSTSSEEDIANFKDLLITFYPMLLYSGNEETKSKLLEMEYDSILWPFFEEEGFMMILKTPLKV